MKRTTLRGANAVTSRFEAPNLGPLATQHLAQGMRDFHRGDLVGAEASYRRAIGVATPHPVLFHNWGTALQGLGRMEDAAAAYRQALALKDDLRESHFYLGLVLAELGRPGEAAAAYQRALPLMRSHAELHYNLANTLRDLGRFDEAIASFRRAIALKPAFPQAYTNLGALLRDLGQWTEATAAFRRACSLDPASAGTWNNLGLVFFAQGLHDDAIASYRRSVGLAPDYTDAHLNLGIVLHALGRTQEAIGAYNCAIAARPANAAAHNNLGTILLETGCYAPALASFEKALALEPARADAQNNLGLALQCLDHLEEAAEAHARAMALSPDFVTAVGNKVNVRRTLCDWRDVDADAERCRVLVRSGKSGQDPFAFITLDSTLAEQQACARSWARDRTRGAVLLPAPPRKEADRLRIGYLSADLRQHSVAILTAELFERHDRSRFEIVAYSSSADDGSALRDRLRRSFDRFVDVSMLSHARAAQRIRDDAIDILVDLSGYTRGGRPAILAARPAPIQVSFLGYPGTMGAPFIDYVIADPVIAPMREQPFYDEKIVHLPDCYMPFDATQAIAEAIPSRSDYGLPETGFVFCCFNNTQKITPAVYDVWMRLLRDVPGSVLWLADDKPAVRANLAREAAAGGVAPERVVFAPMRPLSEHLARHRLADLFLDTLPYNACTTAALALWAGLPVLTCMGDTYAGRMAASILHAACLPDLVTRSHAEYTALALRLAADPALLQDVRRRVSDSRTAPFFDTARYARHLEAAYLRMWQNHTAGRMPEPFAAAL